MGYLSLRRLQPTWTIFSKVMPSACVAFFLGDHHQPITFLSGHNHQPVLPFSEATTSACVTCLWGNYISLCYLWLPSADDTFLWSNYHQPAWHQCLPGINTRQLWHSGWGLGLGLQGLYIAKNCMDNIHNMVLYNTLLYTAWHGQRWHWSLTLNSQKFLVFTS